MHPIGQSVSYPCVDIPLRSGSLLREEISDQNGLFLVIVAGRTHQLLQYTDIFINLFLEPCALTKVIVGGYFIQKLMFFKVPQQDHLPYK